MPGLLQSAKLAVEKALAQGRDESYVKQLSDYIIPALVEALHKVIFFCVMYLLSVFQMMLDIHLFFGILKCSLVCNWLVGTWDRNLCQHFGIIKWMYTGMSYSLMKFYSIYHYKVQMLYIQFVATPVKNVYFLSCINGEKFILLNCLGLVFCTLKEIK